MSVWSFVEGSKKEPVLRWFRCWIVDGGFEWVIEAWNKSILVKGQILAKLYWDVTVEEKFLSLSPHRRRMKKRFSLIFLDRYCIIWWMEKLKKSIIFWTSLLCLLSFSKHFSRLLVVFTSHTFAYCFHMDLIC